MLSRLLMKIIVAVDLELDVLLRRKGSSGKGMRVLRNERVRRHRAQRNNNVNNNSNTLEHNNNQVNSTEKSRQCKRRCLSRENDEEEREFQNRRRERNVEKRRFLEQNSNVDETFYCRESVQQG